jgi:hypothetical protein
MIDNNKIEICQQVSVDKNLSEQQIQIVKNTVEHFLRIVVPHIADPESIKHCIETGPQDYNIDVAETFLKDIISCNNDGDEFCVFNAGMDLAIAAMTIVCHQSNKYEQLCENGK